MSRATLAAAAMLAAAVAGRSTPLMAVLSLSKDGNAALHADIPSGPANFATGHARQELPDGPGKAELSKLCAGCHDLMFTVSTARNRRRMDAEEEFAKVIAYLTAHMGKPGPTAGP